MTDSVSARRHSLYCSGFAQSRAQEFASRVTMRRRIAFGRPDVPELIDPKAPTVLDGQIEAVTIAKLLIDAALDRGRYSLRLEHDSASGYTGSYTELVA